MRARPSSVRAITNEWQRTHPLTRPDPVRAELRLIRSPNRDYGEYIAALDAEMGGLWRKLYGQKWVAEGAEGLVPSEDDWAAHVEHVVKVAGPKHAAIGLDLTHGRDTLRDFDATGYPRLVQALRRRKIPDVVLGENWLRVLDAAKAR